MPDGSRISGQKPNRFVLILKTSCALRRMLLPPTEKSLGMAYSHGYCHILGSLDAAIELFRKNVTNRNLTLSNRLRLLGLLVSLPKKSSQTPTEDRLNPPSTWFLMPHSKTRDAHSIRYHYNLPQQFFRLWLDPWNQYSCAYFPSKGESLEAAQKYKLRRICTILNLDNANHLLDVGCGWGGLIQFAAANYSIKATGITLSEQQAHFARQQISSKGLSDRCRVLVQDYRDHTGNQRYDRIASIGMLPHVGRRKITTYFEILYNLLVPGGLLLNSGTVACDQNPTLWTRLLRPITTKYHSFVQAAIFPDVEVLPATDRFRPAAKTGLDLRYAEDLREHYALTLKHWRTKLENNWAEATDLVGTSVARAWQLWMAGSAHAYIHNQIGLLQVLYSR